MNHGRDAISIAEASALMGVTPDAVRKQIQRGDLDVVETDGATQVRAEPVWRRRRELLERLDAVERDAAPAGDLQALRDDILRKDRLIAQLQAMNSELAVAREATDRALRIAQAALVERELPLDARELEER
jgi:hypothetical protein